MKRIFDYRRGRFIGSNLALALLRKGYQVTVLDNLSPTDTWRNSGTDISSLSKYNR